MAGACLRPGRPGPLRPRHGRVTNLQTTAPHMASGSCDEDHYAAPGSRLTHTYLSGYTSINSLQVIDPKCRPLTMCSSERSPIRLGGLSSNDCAAKENRPWGP